jgi:hypothetical protein
MEVGDPEAPQMGEVADSRERVARRSGQILEAQAVVEEGNLLRVAGKSLDIY